jgi:hypothetical protein
MEKRGCNVKDLENTLLRHTELEQGIKFLSIFAVYNLHLLEIRFFV